MSSEEAFGQSRARAGGGRRADMLRGRLRGCGAPAPASANGVQSEERGFGRKHPQACED